MADLPDPGIESVSPALAGKVFLSLSHQGSPSATEQDAVRKGHTMEFKMTCNIFFRASQVAQW